AWRTGRVALRGMPGRALTPCRRNAGAPGVFLNPVCTTKNDISGVPPMTQRTDTVSPTLSAASSTGPYTTPSSPARDSGLKAWLQVLEAGIRALEQSAWQGRRLASQALAAWRLVETGASALAT